MRLLRYGSLNWGTVCRIYIIYIVIHYVLLPDIGNVQKIHFLSCLSFQCRFVIVLIFCASCFHNLVRAAGYIRCKNKMEIFWK